MTLQFYIQSIAKRAKGVALIDSGATENFMNLDYTWWLKPPIKELKQHWPLFNVDRTVNKSRALHYYTDLQFKTGTQTTNQRFYLSDLGDHKAIFGYPWFAAFQPRVDWKRGWINMSQLPIILSTPDAAKATYVPRTKNTLHPIRKMTDQYFLGRVTIGSTTINEPNTAVPKEYQRHRKVFSEAESQRLPQLTVWVHVIELLPGAPNTLPGKLLPLTQEEKGKMHKFVQEHLKRGMIWVSKSPYAANFFFVKKKDGKLWPVQDYQPINKWTKKNRNISPLIPQVINCLSGCTKFMIVDIHWGYNNIWIKEGDEGKAAFLTHKGLFEPTVMFFSLTMTWWTIGTLLLTNFLTIYIHFSHTPAGVITNPLTILYLPSNPLQPHSIACTLFQIITRILTIICWQFSWPYCHWNASPLPKCSLIVALV